MDKSKAHFGLRLGEGVGDVGYPRSRCWFLMWQLVWNSLELEINLLGLKCLCALFEWQCQKPGWACRSLWLGRQRYLLNRHRSLPDLSNFSQIGTRKTETSVPKLPNSDP